MRAFGFLSFGHYGPQTGRPGFDAATSLREAVEIGVGADELGVNGAYFRVHHFARQSAAPIPLLTAIAARTRNIEVGTGVIDMRYENPLYLAEEAAQLDIIAGGRVALGMSRGSPEPADRGWEAFGYEGSTDPRGADIGRDHFARFLSAIRGEKVADADPAQFGPGQRLAIEPRVADLDRRVWWGAGSRETAEWAARQGINLMGSTLIAEATGASFGELQAEQIERYRAEWARTWGPTTGATAPRVSVSRSVFPVVSEDDRALFGRMDGGNDQIGIIDGLDATFGKTFVGEPDRLIDELAADPAVAAADTLMLTIPSQAGVDINLRILESFATHVAPGLGWKPNTQGPVRGYHVE